MDYVTPHELTAAMVDAGGKKSRLPVSSMLLRGALSGAILGCATTLLDTGTILANPIVGAGDSSFSGLGRSNGWPR